MSNMIDTQMHLGQRNLSLEKVSGWQVPLQNGPSFYHRPTDVEEIVKIVQYARLNHQKVKVIGSGHSPNDIAFTKDHLISMANFNCILDLNREKNTVHCQAGCTLSQLNSYLENEGFGLKALGSISHQTIAGIMATGTHSTGFNQKIISEDIISVKFINGLGLVENCSEDDNPELLNAFKCNLGVLGIILEVVLSVEPLKILEAFQYPLKIDVVKKNWEFIIKKLADHTRLWWFPHTNYFVVWQANKIPFDQNERIETKSYLQKIVIIIGKKIIRYILEFAFYICCCIPSLIPLFNNAYLNLFFRRLVKTRDVSYRVFNFDCLFRQYVSEWAIPIGSFIDAFERLQNMIELNNFRAHFPIEIRSVGADDIMASPCYGRDSIFIGIIMYRPYNKDFPYKKYFDAFSFLMESCGGRPHWAKPHHWDYEQCLRSYPKWETFCQLRKLCDPHDLFLNAYTSRLLVQ